MNYFGLDRSKVAWGIAGIPLLVTFAQTVFALLDWTTDTAGIGAIVDPFLSVDVLFEAAVVFKSRPGMVISLFLLITVAWVGQGVSMFYLQNRDVTFAAAGFASILYLVLFFGVYSSLFGRNIATGQLVGFFAVPIVATSVVAGAAWVHDWSEDVIERSAGELGDLASTVKTRREEFETAYAATFGDLDRLERVAPTGVERATERKAEFEEQCQTLERQIESARSTEDPEQLRAEIADLESQVGQLSPERAIEEIDEELRRRVLSGVRTEFGSVEVRSLFDRQFTLANLPTDYREVELPPSGDAVHVEDLSEVLQTRLERGDSIADVAPAVETAAVQIDSIETFLGETSATVAERIEQIDQRLETCEDELSRLDGAVRERARELLIENRHAEIDGVRAVERTLDDARDALHACQFDECDRLLDAAETDSGALVTTAEFVRGLAGRIEHDAERVTVPADVDPSVVAAMEQAIEREYGVTASVEDRTVLLQADETGTVAGTSSPEAAAAAGRASDAAPKDPDSERSRVGAQRTGRDESGDDIDSEGDEEGVDEQPGDVLDAVLYLFRELETAAERSEDDRVQYQTGELPPAVGRESVLANAERFLSYQSDLVDEVTFQSTEPPGFLEIVVADEVRPGPAIRTARERFSDRYE